MAGHQIGHQILLLMAGLGQLEILLSEGTVYINALDQSIPGVISSISREATREGGVSYYEATLQVDAVSNVRSGMSVEVTVLNSQALSVSSIRARKTSSNIPIRHHGV